MSRCRPIASRLALRRSPNPSDIGRKGLNAAESPGVVLERKVFQLKVDCGNFVLLFIRTWHAGNLSYALPGKFIKSYPLVVNNYCQTDFFA
jgi:hypothetical protein